MLARTMLFACIAFSACGGANEADAGGRSDAAHDASVVDPPGTWRSALFPRDWQPVHAGGAPDAEGRFLPDFSYAGWHRGEAQPPYGQGAASFLVDATLGDGVSDATSAIQSAIDDACAAGGGIVQLPPGTFRIVLPSVDATAIVRIECSGVVLRGEGPTRTRILVDDAGRLRLKPAILVRGGGSVWDGTSTTTHALAADALLPTRSIELASTPSFSVGDLVAVRTDTTDGFRVEHRMDEASSGEAGLWPADQFRGLLYVRRVEAITDRLLTLDGPTHYALHTRDAARVYALTTFLSEVGLESFAIGMIENGTTPGRTEAESEDDYGVSGTTGYEVHMSSAILLDRVRDAWVYDVDSFHPEANSSSSHVLSMGMSLGPGASRVSIEACDLGYPQYRGGGGNGYLFHLQGSDILIVRSSAEHGRHGFIVNQSTSGNVFSAVRVIDSRYSDDSHRFLAHANLYDHVELDRGWLQAVNRGTTSDGAGFTSTQIVFWNTHVIANHADQSECAVESAQWAYGYLIGSRAESGASATLCPRSFTNSYWASLDQGAPEDFVEGDGMGATLFPPSLHAAQLALRCARDALACSAW